MAFVTDIVPTDLPFLLMKKANAVSRLQGLLLRPAEITRIHGHGFEEALSFLTGISAMKLWSKYQRLRQEGDAFGQLSRKALRRLLIRASNDLGRPIKVVSDVSTNDLMYNPVSRASKTGQAGVITLVYVEHGTSHYIDATIPLDLAQVPFATPRDYDKHLEAVDVVQGLLTAQRSSLSKQLHYSREKQRRVRVSFQGPMGSGKTSAVSALVGEDVAGEPRPGSANTQILKRFVWMAEPGVRVVVRPRGLKFVFDQVEAARRCLTEASDDEDPDEALIPFCKVLFGNDWALKNLSDPSALAKFYPSELCTSGVPGDLHLEFPDLDAARAYISDLELKYLHKETALISCIEVAYNWPNYADDAYPFMRHVELCDHVGVKDASISVAMAEVWDQEDMKDVDILVAVIDSDRLCSHRAIWDICHTRVTLPAPQRRVAVVSTGVDKWFTTGRTKKQNPEPQRQAHKHVIARDFYKLLVKNLLAEDANTDEERARAELQAHLCGLFLVSNPIFNEVFESADERAEAADKSGYASVLSFLHSAVVEFFGDAIYDMKTISMAVSGLKPLSDRKLRVPNRVQESLREMSEGFFRSTFQQMQDTLGSIASVPSVAKDVSKRLSDAIGVWGTLPASTFKAACRAAVKGNSHQTRSKAVAQTDINLNGDLVKGFLQGFWSSWQRVMDSMLTDNSVLDNITNLVEQEVVQEELRESLVKKLHKCVEDSMQEAIKRLKAGVQSDLEKALHRRSVDHLAEHFRSAHSAKGMKHREIVSQLQGAADDLSQALLAQAQTFLKQRTYKAEEDSAAFFRAKCSSLLDAPLQVPAASFARIKKLADPMKAILKGLSPQLASPPRMAMRFGGGDDDEPGTSELMQFEDLSSPATTLASSSPAPTAQKVAAKPRSTMNVVPPRDSPKLELGKRSREKDTDRTVRSKKSEESL